MSPFFFVSIQSPPKTSYGRRAQVAKARWTRAANDLLKRCQGAPYARPSHHPSNSARIRRPESAPDNTAEARSTAQVNEGSRSRRTTRTIRLTRHSALAWSAKITLTRRAQRAPTCVDDQKRPRSSARPPALSSNQLRRALTARLTILASQPGRQSTWAGGINGPSGQVQYQIGSSP